MCLASYAILTSIGLHAVRVDVFGAIGVKEYISDDLPYYDNPPVTEVVFGLLFKPLQKFLVPHVGVLWERFRKDFPSCSEVAPLLPVIERLDGSSGQEFEIEVPSMPRIWFSTENGDWLVQVQRDRFHFNWRKAAPDAKYPRYKVVVQEFAKHLETFRAFLQENSFGNVDPIQYELTYVNTILAGEGWDGGLSSINTVLPDFDWRSGKKKLLAPEGINWKTAFRMEDGLGRLHVTVRNGKRPTDLRDLILVELTARGMPVEKSANAMWKWFDNGRRWIVEGFTDLTNPSLHDQVWRRRQ